MSGAQSSVGARWREWPIGSQGPYVTARALEKLRRGFQREEIKRSAQLKTDQKVFLVTEMSNYGELSQGIQDHTLRS
jgi:hypothetical protein